MPKKKKKVGSKYFRVLTVWYDGKGRITNPTEVESILKKYYLGEPIANGRENRGWWADFWCRAREE